MGFRSMKSSFIVLFFLFLLFITSCAPAIDESDDEGILVLDVGDGDTLMLESGEWVRLLGVDAPEKGEEVYEDAKHRLEDLVLEKKVVLEKDVSEKDDYGRLLRYVYVNDKFVNKIMVEEGWAVAFFYEPDTKYKTEFVIAEEEAKNKSLGIWKYEEKDYAKDNETCVRLGCPEGTVFVGSKNSDIYHYCTCEWAEKIKPSNLVCFKSKEEAEANNYRACKVCGPEG